MATGGKNVLSLSHSVYHKHIYTNIFVENFNWID